MTKPTINVEAIRLGVPNRITTRFVGESAPFKGTFFYYGYRHGTPHADRNGFADVVDAAETIVCRSNGSSMCCAGVLGRFFFFYFLVARQPHGKTK